MQNVQSIRPARPDALFRFDARRPLRPATPEMIEAVIRHADRAERLAGGRLRLRLSEAMAQDLVRQGRLDSPDLRLCDLTVVWDEAQGEVVLVRDDLPGGARLVGYALPRDGCQSPESPSLRQHLSKLLPAHMIPTDFVVLSALPLTPNGKIDRRALAGERAGMFARAA
jgi:acyl-CoA synthetase (AMP-forming)/AMP-acid ligase II